MPTALANHAAAIALGYIRSQCDYGAGKSPRFVAIYEKCLAGPALQGAETILAMGTDDSAQATADTNALANLERLRNHRYGFAAAGGSKDSNGSALTVDSH